MFRTTATLFFFIVMAGGHVITAAAGRPEAPAKAAVYADNGDGTVTDKGTGLMWVKDGSSAGCNYGNAAQWTAAVEFCGKLSFAGHSDWRLPSREELMSIVDKSQSNFSINTAFFPNTHASTYWTSTKNYPDSEYAWSVLFFYGGVANYDMSDYYHYVRCVRAGGNK